MESGGGNSNGDDEQILACDLQTDKAVSSEKTNGAAEKLPSIHGAEPTEANVTTPPSTIWFEFISVEAEMRVGSDRGAQYLPAAGMCCA
ncbi:unnamed protein product [Fusarium graminearum]|nr:unnamed protein product [Fusarium graminearum]